MGAAIRDDAFINDHTEQRAARAAKLLEALAELGDPQVGLRLLRACAGYCRMLHSMRCNPPTAHTNALAAFDGLVRSCFAGFTGLHPTAVQWQQAARGFAQAGLGLRSCVSHGPAAYLASLGSSIEACKDIDSRFSVDVVASSAPVAAAVAELNKQLPANRALTVHAALASKQRDLSERIDTAGWEHQLAQAPAAEAVALRSEAGLGARAFLAAIPSGKTSMEPRLGMPDASEDTWCPKCDAVLDKFSHHASVCVAGERNLRRPADIHLPAWAGFRAALDFAVTAPQRQETLARASVETGAAATAYARQKEAHLGTAAACAAQGVIFRPLVVETTGCWEPSAGTFLKLLAGAVATRSGEEAGLSSFRARAALWRRSELAA